MAKELSILDLPYEVLFLIFRKMPGDALIKVSRLCPSFKDIITNDARIWKDKSFTCPLSNPVAFEELYTGPWPIEEINLEGCTIYPPKSTRNIGRVQVAVTKLNLTAIKASFETKEAILAKYQCKELFLDWHKYQDLLVQPYAFSKQNNLQVLSLKSIIMFDDYHRFRVDFLDWLVEVFRNCPNLISLDLSQTRCLLTDALLANLPRQLEKLKLDSVGLEDPQFDALFRRCPNLKELGLDARAVQCESLRRFQALETLYISPPWRRKRKRDLSLLQRHLIRLPKLKTVYCIVENEGDFCMQQGYQLSAMMIPSGIEVKPFVW